MLKHWVVTAVLVAFSLLSGAGHAISPEEKAALLDSIQAYEQMIGEIETVLDEVNKTPIPSDKEQAQSHRAAKWDSGNRLLASHRCIPQKPPGLRDAQSTDAL